MFERVRREFIGNVDIVYFVQVSEGNAEIEHLRLGQRRGVRARLRALIILETLLDASLRQAGDGEIVKRGIIPRVDGKRQS